MNAKGWEVREASVAGACMACDRRSGLVVVRGDVRLCFTCVTEAGKAAMAATGFVRPKRDRPGTE